MVVLCINSDVLLIRRGFSMDKYSMSYRILLGGSIKKKVVYGYDIIVENVFTSGYDSGW